MEQLNVDEIMALQALGMKDTEIRKLRLDDFDRMLEENPDLEDLLDKANELLDRQEEQDVVSIPWHVTAFPDRLKNIGGDCPAVIHCKGNVGLLTRPNIITQRRKGQIFNTLRSFVTRLWQARNGCGLLRIGRSSQRMLRNYGKGCN